MHRVPKDHQVPVEDQALLAKKVIVVIRECKEKKDHLDRKENQAVMEPLAWPGLLVRQDQQVGLHSLM